MSVKKCLMAADRGHWYQSASAVPAAIRAGKFSVPGISRLPFNGTSVQHMELESDTPRGADDTARRRATGRFRSLTSTVGGRNPAHSTAVGKLLLSYQLRDLRAVRDWVGDRTLPSRTSRTATTAEDLHRRLSLVRKNGYSVDDLENEPDVNCVALPVFLRYPTITSGGSASAP